MASVLCSIDHDLRAIALAAGSQGSDDSISYQDGKLVALDVDQATLEDAAANYDAQAVERARAIARIAARRYQAEICGISVLGLPIDTGRDSQGLIAGAALAAIIDPAYVVRWKTEAGFVQLNSTQIISMASAVRAHVQACFDREADMLDALSAGTFTEEIIGQGWPA